MRRAANGLETLSARLVVHQVPEAGKDLLGFRITDYVNAEMDLIDGLTQSRDVEGIKGYRVQAACNVARYQGLDVAPLVVVLERLVGELAQTRGGSHD